MAQDPRIRVTILEIPERFFQGRQDLIAEEFQHPDYEPDLAPASRCQWHPGAQQHICTELDDDDVPGVPGTGRRYRGPRDVLLPQFPSGGSGRPYTPLS